ncbi:reverse transcriptase domain-containing protein [Tanacetum coccineum]
MGLTYQSKQSDQNTLENVKTLANTFRTFSIKQVPRSKNKKADALSKIASTSFAHLSKQVLVEELKEKSVNESEVLVVVEEEGESWMTPIHEYLKDETLPAERKKARAIKPSPKNETGRKSKQEFGEGIKKHMDGKRHHELDGRKFSNVLWAHRTMVKSSNGDTPFSLTYGTEAVIPAEIGMPTFRTAELDMAKNDEALQINLELLEEKREQAAITEAKSKRQMEKYYNAKVRNTSFKPGDLVYRNNEESRAEDTGKLGPKWEGPYEVTEALGKGSYRLKDRNGKELPRTWNVCNLKKCYIHKM